MYITSDKSISRSLSSGSSLKADLRLSSASYNLSRDFNKRPLSWIAYLLSGSSSTALV
jgi:hypothetical protein